MFVPPWRPGLGHGPPRAFMDVCCSSAPQWMTAGMLPTPTTRNESSGWISSTSFVSTSFTTTYYVDIEDGEEFKLMRAPLESARSLCAYMFQSPLTPLSYSSSSLAFLFATTTGFHDLALDQSGEPTCASVDRFVHLGRLLWHSASWWETPVYTDTCRRSAHQ